MMSQQNLNVRHAQVVAAICLAEISEAFGLHDESIDRLVSHMLDLACESDLAVWDLRGTNLEITGRGDPLPGRIAEQLDRERAKDYFELVENAVEVGIHDLYGAPTVRPKKFLHACFRILNKWNVGRSDLFDLFCGDVMGYGKPLSIAEVNDLMLYVRPRNP